MNFLCGDISEDGEEQLGLSILANILLHMPTSPFYKTLIES
jgi:Zn-dependent M16 (insulinase) family peptidase